MPRPENAESKAMAVSGNVLYAGGIFTQAGGVLAPYVAKWNGSEAPALCRPIVDQKLQRPIEACEHTRVTFGQCRTLVGRFDRIDQAANP